MQQIWDIHAPLVTVIQNKIKTPWINSSIVKLIRERNAARRKWQSIRTLELWQNFRKLRNLTKNKIRSSFQQFLSKLLSIKNTCGVLWNNLRKFGIVNSRHSFQTDTVNKDGLIDHFTCSVNLSPIQIDDVTKKYLNMEPISNEEFNISNVDIVTVKNSLLNVKTSSVGSDSISIKMLTPLFDIVLPYITNIFNSSILDMNFPTCWKIAHVTPLPKVLKPCSVNDYRPISILSILSKALEKIVYDQVVSFLLRNNLMDIFQSGFRKLHSTTTALLRITEDIRLGFGRGDITIMVSLDFSKAFDCVVHEILLAKMASLNFSETSIKWFNSYLRERKHRVKNSAGFSKWRDIECGVPQGSVLGPLLYSLYIYDIKNCLKHCQYHIYADDVQLYLRCKSYDLKRAVQLINSDLQNLFAWSTEHGLKLNPSKSTAIIFRPKNLTLENVPVIHINNVEIPYSDYVKNLGLTFDCNLNWSKHVSSVCQRVHYALHRLYKFRSLTPIATRIRLVNSLILPLFDYSAVAYCNLDSSCLDRLQVAQNNCVRYIYNLKKRDRITHFYSKLGWLKIRERHDLQILTYCHKILHGFAPAYLSGMLILMGSVRERSSRSHPYFLQAPLVGRDAPEKSFSVTAYRLWNSLKPDICKTKNTATFRKNVENILMKRYLTAKL